METTTRFARRLGGPQSGITQKLRKVFSLAHTEAHTPGEQTPLLVDLRDTVRMPMDEHTAPTVRP